MTSPSFSDRSPACALEYEIAQEKASALGRLGCRLEQTLQQLANFDAGAGRKDVLSPAERRFRTALVARAGHALWLFIVQREACGLRDSKSVMRAYNAPEEVQNCAGAFPTNRSSPGL